MTAELATQDSLVRAAYVKDGHAKGFVERSPRTKVARPVDGSGVKVRPGRQSDGLRRATPADRRGPHAHQPVLGRSAGRTDRQPSAGSRERGNPLLSPRGCAVEGAPVRGPKASSPASQAKSSRREPLQGARSGSGVHAVAGAWRWTDRGIAVVLAIATLLMLSALTCVGVTAYHVSGDSTVAVQIR